MTQQIKIFNVPTSDLTNENFDITIVDSIASDTGQSIVNFMRNRNLTSAWATTESTDAAFTQIIGESGDRFNVTDIIIIGHNFKNFDLEYFDGIAWILIENYVHNTSDFTHISFDSIETTAVRILVYGTIVADDDKIITRFILCEKMLTGQFESWPIIEKPTQRIIRKDSVMLSGKHFMSEMVGAFSVSLKWQGVTTQADLDLLERMFLFRKPFMIWLCGGDDTQFRFSLAGYRNEDLYIMKSIKDYENPYYKGIYDTMIPMRIDLVEVVQ